LVHLTRTHVHADANGAYNRAINGKISTNICCDTATSLERHVAVIAADLASILTSFSRKPVSDHGSAVFDGGMTVVLHPRLHHRARRGTASGRGGW
jgi:hypothetical protein